MAKSRSDKAEAQPTEDQDKGEMLYGVLVLGEGETEERFDVVAPIPKWYLAKLIADIDVVQNFMLIMMKCIASDDLNRFDDWMTQHQDEDVSDFLTVLGRLTRCFSERPTQRSAPSSPGAGLDQPTDSGRTDDPDSDGSADGSQSEGSDPQEPTESD